MEYRTHVGRWRSVDNETTGSGTDGGKDQGCPRRQLVLTMGPGGNSDEVYVASPGEGWSPSVPVRATSIFEPPVRHNLPASPERDRGFESVFLHRRVSCEPAFLSLAPSATRHGRRAPPTASDLGGIELRSLRHSAPSSDAA